MNRSTYVRTQRLVSLFVGLLVSLSITLHTYLLAIVAVSTGMLFLALVRKKGHIVVDERERQVQEKAAQSTYAIFAPTIGLGALLLIFFARGDISAIKEEFYFLESLGMVLAYLTCFLITLYAISYYFFNHKYGGGTDEE